MRKLYNQKNLVMTIDGYNIQDFHEGATCVFTYDGGEVDKTQGTDGASVNLATDQGATIRITLRESSRSLQFFNDLRARQYNGGTGVTVTFRTGTDIIHTMTDAYVGNPGELSTGDKKMGGITFVVTSAEFSTQNMAQLDGLNLSGIANAVNAIAGLI